VSPRNETSARPLEPNERAEPGAARALLTAVPGGPAYLDSASGKQELEVRWSAWLLARNRRATLICIWFNALLYPLFGVLDYFVVPHQWLWLLWGTRALVFAVTLVMFRIVRSSLFERHSSALSAAYQVLISWGISLMTVIFGGLASSYYAGLNLVMLGAGLLFVWPRSIVLSTHAAIVASFILPNWIMDRSGDAFTSVSNLFFLCSTASIAVAGQLVAFRVNREQVANMLVIESTTQNLERAHSQLQQLDRFKSEFFANITHELKTPLTMILAPLELMIQGELGRIPDAQRATLESMLRSGVKLLKLIGNLLDLSKLDESRLRLQVSEHDLAIYLNDLVAQIHSLAHRKGISLTFESSAERVMVHCDLERLERVFVNLLSNAAKFTPSGGSIRVSLFDEGDRARIAVADSGIGFPQDMAEKIFERFVQVDMAGTRKFGGTGIGLALARELILLHGGTIRARSEVGAGATFTVELLKDREHFDPVRVDRRARREDLLEGNRAGDRGLGDWEVEAKGRFRFIDIDEATDQRVVKRDADEHERSQSVLVVDDTPDVIRVIHLALRNQFRVLAAPDGVKGFELATKHMPSLIITDLMMPEVDGMELTRRLRNDLRTRHIPIVMLTARGHVEDRAQGMDAGINAYLTKPFSAKELLSTVRGLVRIQENNADLVLTHSMDSLQTIAGGLAHEINNPLNYIKSALAMIQSDGEAMLSMARSGGTPDDDSVEPLSSRMMKMFQVADTGLRRIGATVELMQRYSREGYSRTLQCTDVYGLARDVVAMLEGTAQRTISMTFEGDGRMECVPDEVNQVLTNLIQNAIDATASDGTGRVEVRGIEQSGELVISVIDNGHGVRPEVRSKIFTPFYTTKEVGKGMGLGLTIVRRVVASLGGTVHLTSQVGAGSEFTLKLPRTRPASLPANQNGLVDDTGPYFSAEIT
jgi:signal transduction histidine kinase